MKDIMLKEMKTKGIKDSDMPQGKRKKVLLLTTWRSGSTFLGQVMSWFPGSFYSFEPLYYFNKHPDAANSTSYNKVLSDILNCSFSQEYFETIDHMYQKFTITSNERLFKICKKDKKCYKHDYISSLCTSFPINIAKTVRHRVEDIKPLLEADPDLKVVVLFRDPRGVFNSRRIIDWCMKNPKCGSPEIACEHMDRDVKATYILDKEFPGQIHLLRYEDYSLYPLLQTRALASFLGLKFVKAMEDFVQAHTEDRKFVNNRHSTFYNSKSHTFEWRDSMDWKLLSKVQRYCEGSMTTLGYRNISSKDEMKNSSVSLLIKSANQIWKYKGM